MNGPEKKEQLTEQNFTNTSSNYELVPYDNLEVGKYYYVMTPRPTLDDAPTPYYGKITSKDANKVGFLPSYKKLDIHTKWTICIGAGFYINSNDNITTYYTEKQIIQGGKRKRNQRKTRRNKKSKRKTRRH
jgi:hypothetical protein